MRASEPGLAVIATKVRIARAVRRMSQAELSQRAGLNTQTVMRLENAQHPPLAATILRIAEVLDVPLAWLLNGDETMPWDD